MYYIKKKKLARRTFLRHSGIAIALPFLDAMIPAFARAQSATPPLRVAYLYFPHGTHPGLHPWKAQTSGNNFALPKGLASTNMVNHQNDIILMGGLLNHWSQYNIYGDGGNDHPAATLSYLTGARMNWKSQVASLTLSTQNASSGPLPVATTHKSVDVLISDHIKGNTSIPILNLTPPGFAPYDGGTAQFDTAYRTYMSWQSGTQPTPRHENPASAFRALFGNIGSPTPPPPSGPSLTDRKRSILDFVLSQANDLRKDLGSLDRLKLDEFLSSVRDVERKLQSTDVPPSPGISCEPGNAPNSDLGFPEMTKAYLDIIALAFQCDQTRVVSYLMDYELNNRRYSFAGANRYDSHQASHGNFAEDYGDAFKIVNWWADQFAYLLSQLKSKQDVFGPILNNSIIHMGSGTNTTGGDHPDQNLPMIIAGSGGGILNTGRAINLSTTRLENYHLTLMNKIGMNISNFGGSNGTITGL